MIVALLAPGALLALAVGCADEGVLVVTAAPSAMGVRVEASAALDAVDLLDGAAVIAHRDLPTPTATAELVAAVPPGRYTLRARRGEQFVETTLTVGTPPPVRVQIQVSPSEPWRDATGDIDVPVLAGSTAEVIVGVTGGEGMPPQVATSLGDAFLLRGAGVRLLRTVLVRTTAVDVTVGDARVRLVPHLVPADSIKISEVRFPAAEDGTPDVGRPAMRITVPAGWWDDAVRALGWGARRRDAFAPWSFHGVRLRNTSSSPVDVVVRARVTRGGLDAPAFHPRLREADGGTGAVSILVRVPANGLTLATLPLFVDLGSVTDGAYLLETDVIGTGGGVLLATHSDVLYVRHGDTVAHVGFAASLVAAVSGLLWTACRLKGWLDAAQTSELMTIALFSGALFVVGSASDLATMAIGAVLGPFATLATGLIADVGRTVLLGTLVALTPRPGTLAMAILTGYLLRALAMGSVSPADGIYVGAAIAAQEGMAWVSGLSRGRPATFLRLAVTFGGASVGTTFVGLWMHIVLYRLFFAPWYVAMQVLVPGLFYTAAACWIAAGFAASLRQVDA